MKLDATKFGLALALSTSSLWIICSVLVALSPATMARIAGYMVHAGAVSIEPISIFGVFVGVVGWSLASGLIGWLLATIYNRL